MELRYEYKYIIPLSKEMELRKMLIPFVELDKYALGRKNNEYTVRSIYFDTPDFQFYRDKIEGLAYRKKVRLRGYNALNGANPVFMEIKKKYQDPLLKTRARITFEDALKVLNTGELLNVFKSLSRNHEDANRFLYQIHSKRLRPVILVVYEREPYGEKIQSKNRLRITFDKRLRSSVFPTLDNLYSEEDIKYSMDGYFILEVKFNEFFPAWMKPIVATFGMQRRSASKYAISIDTHDLAAKASRIELMKRKII